MAGIKYENMPRPKQPFRPDRDTRSVDGKVTFDTFSSKLKEDADRAALIMKTIDQYPGLFGDEAIDLANRLVRGVETHNPPATPASSLFMRNVRISVIGNLWRLVEDEALQPAVTATLQPAEMWVPADELMAVNPNTFMRRLRADLYRAGFGRMHGYLLVGLHSEFDVNRGGYDFHYHLAAGGEMATAIDNLRSVRRFQAGRIEPHERDLPQSTRIMVSREQLYNLPSPLTYILQSSHPHRPTTVNPYGIRKRSSSRLRIPEPHHTRWLLWMDQWSVSDLMFCVGMIPTNSGFQLTP